MKKIYQAMQKNVIELLIKQGVDLLLEDKPGKNGDRLFNLVKKFTKDETSKETIEFVHNYYKNNPATTEFVERILTTTDKKCLTKLFSNFFSNATLFGVSKRQKLLVEEDVKVPFTILISPSMRCNLRCTGCYAADYEKKDDIPFEEVDRIVGEARDLGIYYFIVLGGEPFFIEYMLDIYEKYNDIIFMPFTNGTLFNAKLADKIRNLGNVVPIFSLEGFEESTDARRGKGVFNKVMEGMDLLKERGVLFGVSSAVAKHNMEEATSDKFIDLLIDKGAKIGFYFLYMPVGMDPDFNAMLTPDQRIELGRRTRNIRQTKPYFPIDFFNDAPYVGGCISGKYYCHINSKEDVEPCIFAHYACDNLKGGKKLIDVFRSPFFKALRKKQPYNENLLMPCMMIDNPDMIRQIVHETGAYPTDDSAKKMISDPEFMKQLHKVADDFKPHAEEAWDKDFNRTGNFRMSKG